MGTHQEVRGVQAEIKVFATGNIFFVYKLIMKFHRDIMSKANESSFI